MVTFVSKHNQAWRLRKILVKLKNMLSRNMTCKNNPRRSNELIFFRQQNISPLNFKFSPHPPLFSPHPSVFSPLRYVRSRPTISCELGGCSHFAPRTKQIKTSGGALGQPNRIGWRKTGAWHAPDGTYTAVTGAIRVSVRPACRNPSLRGRYSKHKNNN